MASLLPAIVCSIIGTATLTLVYYYLYTRQRSRALYSWSLSWLCYTLRLGFEVYRSLVPDTALLLALFQLITLFSGLLLLWGLYFFIHKPVSLFWKVGMVASALWLVVALVSNAPPLWFNIPTFTFLALVYIWSGIVFLRQKEINVFSRYLIGIVFILWGLHRADYPFLQPLAWFAPWGYLLGSALGTIAGLGILLIYYQRIEDELAQSERKFRTVADFTYDWEYWIGPDRHFIYMSPSSERITGYRPEEFMQAPGLMEQIAYFEDRQKIVRHFDEASLSEEACTFDFRIVTRLGQVRWIGHVCQPVYDSQGHFIGRRSSNRDITKQKRTEEDLRRNEQQYRFLTENMKDVVWILDVDSLCFRYVSPSVERLRGYTAEEVAARPMDDAIMPDFRNHFRNLIVRHADDFLSRRIPADHFYTNEIEQTCKDGSTVWTEMVTRYYFNEERDKVELIGVTREISERKKAEAKIRTLNQELEQRVIERTAQIGVLNHELEAFSYSVSHDLRAPLRTLEGFSQVILEDYGNQLDDAGKDYLNRIRNASKRMASLIDDLLQLSRISRSSPEFTEIDLSLLAQKVFNELIEVHSERQIDFLVDPKMIVKADERMMRIVLTHLIGNAIKFTRKCEQACIEISSKKEEGKQIYFVKDNGVGFNMAHVEKLYHAFQRLHSSAEYDGNGIGLAIVKRIILHHGGKVWAESSANKGATFYFTLG
jgi:PAS domain S-box-containing protein